MYKPALPFRCICILLYSCCLPAIGFAQIQEPPASIQAAAWTLITTTNEPAHRHENGFVAYDGKLYLLGGRGIKRVQIYDPATKTWADGAYPPIEMHHFQAVVYDDMIYIVAGYKGACCASEFGIPNVYTYSPKTDVWTKRHDIPVERQRGSTGAVVFNDKIYVAGGLNGGHGSPSTSYKWFDVYDPATGNWETLPDAPRVRDHFHAVLYNSKMYLIGGRDTSDPSVTGAVISQIDVFNFNTNSWSTLGSSKNLPTPRGGTSSVLYQGQVLVIGGETANQTLAHKNTEAFDLVTESWSTLADLNVGRHGTQASVLDNVLYIAAGSGQRGGTPELSSIEKYSDGAVEPVAIDHVLKPGWNLIGLPITPVNNDFREIYTDVALTYSVLPMNWVVGASAYQKSATMATGKAYWMKLDDGVPSPQVQTIYGSTIASLNVSLESGWNMVSGPSCSGIVLLGSSTNPVGAIPTGSVYYYDHGYVPAYSSSYARGRINQGVGYWIYASKAATLTLSCNAGKVASRSTPPFESLNTATDDSGRLFFQDANGLSRALYFGAALDDPALLDAFHLPPRSFDGSFDVRFNNNGRFVESDEGYIRVQASAHPLQLRYERSPFDREGTLEIVEHDAAGPIRAHELTAGEVLSIRDASTEYVAFRFIAAGEKETPETFVVHGNYPNPFNPTTRIVFDLPAAADVKTEIFDMLGRSIAVLPHVYLSPGANRSIEVDASAWPAGAYVYRLTADMDGHQTVHTGRMVLLK